MYHVNAQGVDERMINVHYYLFVLGLCCYWVCVACIRVLFVLGLCSVYLGLVCTGSVLRVSGSCLY